MSAKKFATMAVVPRTLIAYLNRLIRCLRRLLLRQCSVCLIKRLFALQEGKEQEMNVCAATAQIALRAGLPQRPTPVGHTVIGALLTIFQALHKFFRDWERSDEGSVLCTALSLASGLSYALPRPESVRQ